MSLDKYNHSVSVSGLKIGLLEQLLYALTYICSSAWEEMKRSVSLPIGPSQDAGESLRWRDSRVHIKRPMETDGGHLDKPHSSHHWKRVGYFSACHDNGINDCLAKRDVMPSITEINGLHGVSKEHRLPVCVCVCAIHLFNHWLKKQHCNHTSFYLAFAKFPVAFK